MAHRSRNSQMVALLVTLGAAAGCFASDFNIGGGGKGGSASAAGGASVSSNGSTGRGGGSIASRASSTGSKSSTTGSHSATTGAGTGGASHASSSSGMSASSSSGTGGATGGTTTSSAHSTTASTSTGTGGCAGGNTSCGGTCVDTQTNPNHCATCNHSCAGLSCVASECVLTSPTELPGVVLWFDAADASTVLLDVQQLVMQWSDKGPNAQHVTQPTTSVRPTYQVGVAVNFDGSQSLSRTTIAGLPVGNADRTCFYVLSGRSDGNYQLSVGYGVEQVGAEWHLLDDPSGDIALSTLLGGVHTSTPWPAVPVILTGAAAAGVISLSLNGVLLGTDSSAFSTDGTGPLNISGEHRPPTSGRAPSPRRSSMTPH